MNPWIPASLAECALGLGDEPGCGRWMEAAKSLKPAPEVWMLESTKIQLAELRNVIRLAPGKGIQMAAPTPVKSNK